MAEAAAVHGFLQGITLPTEDVVTVLAVASAVAISALYLSIVEANNLLVAGAQVEGLGTVGGPVGLVTEVAPGVPDNLEGDLASVCSATDPGTMSPYLQH